MDDRHDEYFVRADRPAPPPDRPAPPPRRPTRVPLLLVAALLVVAGTAIAAGLAAVVTDDEAPPAPTAPATTSPPAADAPPPAPVVEDGFALWGRRDDGTPIRWDPCEPIRWVFNPDGAPPTGQADVAAALQLVADASGLSFRFDGLTDEVPSWHRPLLQPERYGDRWAPVLVAWTGPDDELALTERQRGAAVPVAVSTSDGETLFVSGQVVLNATADLDAGFGDRSSSWGAVLAHEGGHLVGLDHVDDRSQLMYPETAPGPAIFGIGDRRGLQAVGARGGCLDVPVARDIEVDYRSGIRP
jgi:hypothetical protein